jgi:hypothetical protein
VRRKTSGVTVGNRSIREVYKQVKHFGVDVRSLNVVDLAPAEKVATLSPWGD